MVLDRPGSGFSLVELVIVILLIGILAAAVFPRFSSPPITVGAQADQMAADMRYVQSLSMSRGVRYCLYWGSSNSAYEIRNNNCTTAVTHPGSSSTTTALSNVTFTASGFSVAYLEFDTKGRPTTITSLASGASLALVRESESRVITVSGETGRVKVQAGS
jgi:MSHA pilin protein MshC